MKKVFTVKGDYRSIPAQECLEWIREVFQLDDMGYPIEETRNNGYAREKITIIVEIIDENKPKIIKEKENEKI